MCVTSESMYRLRLSEDRCARASALQAITSSSPSRMQSGEKTDGIVTCPFCLYSCSHSAQSPEPSVSILHPFCEALV
jgi:hypothetical protein